MSGLKLSFDAARPAGDRVVSLAVVDEAGEVVDIVARDGALLGVRARDFRIVTLNFLADGGDGYLGSPSIPGSGVTVQDRVDLFGPNAPVGFETEGREQQALADYLADNFATEDQAFADLDLGPEAAGRIQNLAFREDTVLPEDPASGAEIEVGLALGVGSAPLRNIACGAGGVAYDSRDDDDLTGDAVARFRAENGEIAATSIEFGRNITYASDPAFTLDWSEDGSGATLELTERFTLPTARVRDFTGDSLTIRGFEEQIVDLPDAAGDLDVTL